MRGSDMRRGGDAVDEEYPVIDAADIRNRDALEFRDADRESAAQRIPRILIRYPEIEEGIRRAERVQACLQASVGRGQNRTHRSSGRKTLLSVISGHPQSVDLVPQP